MRPGWRPDPVAPDRLGYSQEFSARSRLPLSFDLLFDDDHSPLLCLFQHTLSADAYSLPKLPATADGARVQNKAEPGLSSIPSLL